MRKPGKLGDADDRIAIGAQPVDDPGQRRHRLLAVAAAIVEQHDVGTAPIGVWPGRALNLADSLFNYLVSTRRLPVTRIDVQADDGIAALLGKFCRS